MVVIIFVSILVAIAIVGSSQKYVPPEIPEEKKYEIEYERVDFKINTYYFEGKLELLDGKKVKLNSPVCIKDEYTTTYGFYLHTIKENQLKEFALEELKRRVSGLHMVDISDKKAIPTSQIKAVVLGKLIEKTTKDEFAHRRIK